MDVIQPSDPNQDDPSSSESLPSTPQMINLNVHKAGLDNLDKDRINKIIQENSKGSTFYSYQQKRQKRIEQQIKQLKEKLEHSTPSDTQSNLKKADSLIAELERFRVVNRIIVHFDMDMFFAAVELKNNPSIADKPVAVGSLSMISTSNYVARKFGVRSAMPGFIAKKLCPQLILIRPNFKSYQVESEAVMKILREYDPDFKNFSLDEVYLDLTDYVFDKYCNVNSMNINDVLELVELPQEIWDYAFDCVSEIRSRVFKDTKLTISAGISCNTMIAKVCTDVNKPNGQFMVKGYNKEILDFVSNTEVRKFCGVGPVRGQILSSFNIVTGADLYKERATLVNLFSIHNCDYYFRIFLGIGSSYLGGDDGPQKSHSREHTVGKIENYEQICDLLKDIANRVSSDLKSNSQKCKTITLKLKKVTFEVFLKSKTINTYTDDHQIIFNTAKDLLSMEISKSTQNCYRLIGIKVSNLKESDSSSLCQSTLSQHFIKDSIAKTENKSIDKDDEIECRLCGLTFEDTLSMESHRSYCNGDLEEFTDLIDSTEIDKQSELTTKIEVIPETDTLESEISANIERSTEFLYLSCPICKIHSAFSNNDELNRHIDLCLNRDICIELTQIPTTSISSTPNTNSVPSNKRSLSKSVPNRSKKLKSKQTKNQIKQSNLSTMKIENYFN